MRGLVSGLHIDLVICALALQDPLAAMMLGSAWADALVLVSRGENEKAGEDRGAYAPASTARVAVNRR
jgi:hypothetical protein